MLYTVNIVCVGGLSDVSYYMCILLTSIYIVQFYMQVKEANFESSEILYCGLSDVSLYIVCTLSRLHLFMFHRMSNLFCYLSLCWQESLLSGLRDFLPVICLRCSAGCLAQWLGGGCIVRPSRGTRTWWWLQSAPSHVLVVDHLLAFVIYFCIRMLFSNFDGILWLTPTGCVGGCLYIIFDSRYFLLQFHPAGLYGILFCLLRGSWVWIGARTVNFMHTVMAPLLCFGVDLAVMLLSYEGCCYVYDTGLLVSPHCVQLPYLCVDMVVEHSVLILGCFRRIICVGLAVMMLLVVISLY